MSSIFSASAYNNAVNPLAYLHETGGRAGSPLSMLEHGTVYPALTAFNALNYLESVRASDGYKAWKRNRVAALRAARWSAIRSIFSLSKDFHRFTDYNR